MIKLKHSLIWLLIGWFIIIGGSFVNAWKIWYIWELTQSTYNNNYSFQVNWQWNLLTQYFWLWKRILQFTDWVYFFRWLNWIPYIYVSSNYSWPTWNSQQWYLKNYALCDYIWLGSWNASQPQNCQSYSINWLSNFLPRYLWSLTNNWYYYYDYYQNNVNPRQAYCWALTVCFSNSSFSNSLCFYWSNWGFKYPCDNWSLGFPNWIYWNDTNLENSLWLSPYFDSVDNSVLWVSPWQSGGWNNTNDNTTNVTIQSCPTIAQILKNNYTSNYNSWLCYNNTTYFNGTNFETITKDNIFTIFNDNYENYTNRISIYRNNCTNANTTQACQNAFSWQYKKYSIIANAQQSNVDEKKLWNYCNLALNYDPNTTTCVWSWLIKEQPTQEEILNDILNINTGVPIPWNATTTQNNNVFNSLCDPNNPQNCYWSWNVRDIFWSMQRIYGKITWLFIERSGVDGIIPDYILRITFLTILFTIIFKK